jgi:hypothetical protein
VVFVFLSWSCGVFCVCCCGPGDVGVCFVWVVKIRSEHGPDCGSPAGVGLPKNSGVVIVACIAQGGFAKREVSRNPKADLSVAPKAHSKLRRPSTETMQPPGLKGKCVMYTVE